MGFYDTSYTYNCTAMSGDPGFISCEDKSKDKC